MKKQKGYFTLHLQQKKKMLKKKDFLEQSSYIITLGIPILLGQLAQLSMSIVDTVMAGHSGAVEMAAVGVGGSFWVPIILFSQGLATCISPLVAQGRGANQDKDLSRFFRQGFWLLGVLSIILVIAMSICADNITNFKSIEPELTSVTARYIDYIKWGLPAILMFFVCRFYLEGNGHTRPAMIAGFVGLAFNIVLNYIFVFGHLGFPAMGGAGCGLASAIVCWVMLFVMLYYMRVYELGVTAIVKPNFKEIFRIFRIGLPAALALLLESSSFALIALFVSPLGSITVASNQIAISTTSLLFMFPLSLGMTVTILIGFTLGLKDMDKAVQIRQTGAILGIIVASISCSILFFARDFIANIYTIDSDVAKLASTLLIFAAIYQISDAIQVILIAVLRAYNDTLATFIISIIAYWLITMPVGYLLCFTDIIIPKQGVSGFWIALIIGLTVSAILLIIRVKRLERMPEEQITAKISK